MSTSTGPTKSHSIDAGIHINNSANGNGDSSRNMYTSGKYDVLSPPQGFKSLSFSPGGNGSDFSNEAAGGHSGYTQFPSSSPSTNAPTIGEESSSSAQLFRSGFGHDGLGSEPQNSSFTHIEQSTNAAAPVLASASTTVNASESISNGAQGADEMIPTTFDEATLRALCDMDVSNDLAFDLSRI